jgi:hypothetical protein
MYLTFQHFFCSSILWRRKISELFFVPPSTLGTEEAPEEEEEEEEEVEPKNENSLRPSKRPRRKSSGPNVGTRGEGSAKKAKTASSSGAWCFDSKREERDRIKMLTTAEKGTRLILPGAT